MAPCLNNGTCNQDATDATKFTCDCVELTTGDRCETRLSILTVFGLLFPAVTYTQATPLPNVGNTVTGLNETCIAWFGSAAIYWNSNSQLSCIYRDTTSAIYDTAVARFANELKN
jgi:hypothetical protein